MLFGVTNGAPRAKRNVESSESALLRHSDITVKEEKGTRDGHDRIGGGVFGCTAKNRAGAS